MRCGEINRKTNETDIALSLNLDGSGIADINSGCGFLDHMLTLFAVYSGFDLSVKCDGDTYVDYHHSVEDIGIALGAAFSTALGNKAGIARYGDIILPMDEALIMCAVDISGRAHLSYDVSALPAKIGDFDTELVEEFLLGFVRNSNITLHIKQMSGKNAHHIVEGVFKALGRTLKKAVYIADESNMQIPSSKGVL